MLPVLLQLVAFVAYLRKSPSSGTSSLVVPLRKQLEVFTGLSSLMQPSSLGATSASNFNPFSSNNLLYYSDISETCCFNNFHYLKLQPTSLGCALLIQNAEPSITGQIGTMNHTQPVLTALTVCCGIKD